MPVAEKRKKIKVRVSPTRKSLARRKESAPLEIDLSSANLEERISPPVFRFPLKASEGKSQKMIEGQEKKDAPREKKTGKEKGVGLKINLYRKIALSFIFLTLALLAIIFYFSLVKITIILTPKEERISGNLIIDIYDKNKQKQDEAVLPDKGAVMGIVEQIEVEETKTYSATGAEITGEEVTGRVVVINNYNKNQPLVATTRLLTADGKLFRIRETINAPAGGSREVEVYADQPSQEMAIAPTKFTIPGLWAGLQDKIYALSRETMQYQQKAKKYIKQSDIDAGLVDLRKAIIAKAESAVSEKHKDYSQKLYQIDDNSISADVDSKIGDEKENFAIIMKANVAVVAFLDEPITKTAQEKLVSSLASDRELIGFDKNTISYNLDNFNFEQGIATVNVSFEGRMSLKESGSLIEREKILGLSRKQLNDYLANLPGILNYEVQFSPSFIDKVPKLVDRIKVKIKY